MEKHYCDLVNKTKKKAQNIIKEGDFTFAFLTDLHMDLWDSLTEETRNKLKTPLHVYIEHQLWAAVQLSKELPLDCIVLGGDIIHGMSSYETSMTHLRKVVEILSEADVPTFVVHGNHDDNGYHSGKRPHDPLNVPKEFVINKEVWTQNVVMPLGRGKEIHDIENPLSSYYYVDIPEKKKRLIVLDPFDCPIGERDGKAIHTSESWNILSTRQMQWFAYHALDKEKEGWEYIVFSHTTLGTNPPNGRPFHNAYVVSRIIECFNRRLEFRESNYGIRVDFRKGVTSEVHLSFNGENHVDYYNYYEKYLKMLMLGTSNSFPIGNAKDADHTRGLDFVASVERVIGSETEPLFDIFNISREKIVNRIRFGAGVDQTLDYSMLCE